MNPRSSPVDTSAVALGQRRGISDLARIALDLTWASKRAEANDSARSRAYPSPPMSGSPPISTKPFQGVGERGQVPGGYSTANPQDGYRGISNQQSPIDNRGPPNMPPSLPRLFQQEQQEAMPYPYHRPEESLPRSAPYVQPGAGGMPQQSSYLPAGGASGPGPYPPHNRPLVAENQQMTSPKSQRKTKGHVASACVPCKRAHLRVIAAQRPCSRCITNGKEESCVDVQHKKRGRPRLRDDRDTRYDPSRFPNPQDAAARRPLSIYPSGGSSMSSSMPPRYLERASAADPNAYTVPPSIATRMPEPVAFLNMKMEFAKVSPTFAEGVGINVQGMNLSDIVVSTEREKVSTIRGQLLEEQTRKEPNYLPPILGRLDHIIQGLGFSAEEVGRFQLERQEYLTFQGYDRQFRQHPVRLGLAKEGSIYFVVMMLNHTARHSYPQAPSPLFAQGYSPQPQTPQVAYGQRAPASVTSFDPTRQRFNEGPLGSQPPSGPSGPLPPNPTPGMGPGAPSYAASPGRQEYPGPTSYHIPRSELTTPIRPRPQQSFQLPPIRAQQHQGEHPGERAWSREERPGRLDIGGLIEKPDASGRPR
ncbi:hypothetical protein EDB81DRAFT_638935 [Dactylonectria macrodidyma]|uniref:Zn(2)-C6 fungal-type domain-containing protein n=1 Tax=Dactylonectria macrodidyma TaxID=307937 RepID=A0A9P9FKN6_9HYPO|nr:hypothetical protein EDB81DRAFT_638935 [Dactylonectria macrodidyma]